MDTEYNLLVYELNDNWNYINFHIHTACSWVTKLTDWKSALLKQNIGSVLNICTQHSTTIFYSKYKSVQKRIY